MCEMEKYGRLHCMQSRGTLSVAGNCKCSDCISINHHHVIFGLRHCRDKGLQVCRKEKKKKKTQHSSPMSVTCGEVSSFGFDFLLRRRRHVCSDAESAARRNRSACQNKSPLYSAWNCGLHFSLDRQRGFFPEHCLETVRGDVTRSREERADVGRSRRVACSLNMGIWCR